VTGVVGLALSFAFGSIETFSSFFVGQRAEPVAGSGGWYLGGHPALIPLYLAGTASCVVH
jgi:hypothetical protein